MEWEPSDIDRWLPARLHPETYPGDRPPGSYLLLDGVVCPLLTEPNSLSVVGRTGDHASLDDLLERAGLPVSSERVAVLAYGANRNPATLKTKLENYRYRNPGSAEAIPVLKGTIGSGDVAACGLSGQGYMYGDLVVDPSLVGATACEVWLALVDDDQLRVLNDSEIGTGDYSAALFPDVDVGGPLGGPVLGYAARRPCFVSPALRRPLAFSTVLASGRSFPEMTAIEMLDHVVAALGLRDLIAEIVGANPPEAAIVASYLNRNWWRRFHGGTPSEGYKRILRLVDGAVARHSTTSSTAEVLAGRGLGLSDDEARSPDVALRWGQL